MPGQRRDARASSCRASRSTDRPATKQQPTSGLLPHNAVVVLKVNFVLLTTYQHAFHDASIAVSSK